MSSVICFNLDQSKILSSGYGLKDMCICYSHRNVKKHNGKMRKKLIPIFFTFSVMFSKTFFLGGREPLKHEIFDKGENWTS